MYSYYYTGTASVSEFDGDGQLTGAVNYVVNDAGQQVYRTIGHGEATLSSTITDLMNKNNYQVEEWNLLMEGSVPEDCELLLINAPTKDLTEEERTAIETPEDCELLLINAPTKDLTEEERTAIETYLGQGGDVMLLLGEKNAAEMPNFAALMKTYGMEPADGYIADPERCYQGNYYYLFPQLSLSDEMADGISSEMVLVINAHGFTVTDAARDTITTTAFMNSSDHAYAITEEKQTEGARDTITTTAFMNSSDHAYAITEEKQTEGAYALGAVAVETIEDETESESTEKSETTEDSETKESRFTVISAGSLIDSQITDRFTVISAGSLIDSQITDTFTTLENTTIFMNAVTANFDGVENLSIEPKSLSIEYNTVQHIGVFSLLVIFGIPVLILVVGFVVWFKRRKM